MAYFQEVVGGRALCIRIFVVYTLISPIASSYSTYNKDKNSTISTTNVYLCNLSLPLSKKQGHLHSSRIPLEGSAVSFHTHYGIQPRTWYQAHYHNLLVSARHLEAQPKRYIEELHK